MPNHGNENGTSAAERMSLVPALKVLVNLRGDGDLVVATMGSVREWPKLSDHPLDFHYLPSTMSGGLPLGLGLALAQPDREVMVLSGDGSLVMSLGALVTIVDSRAANLTVVLIDNGVYEITGGQKTAAAGAAVDFGGLARACGFSSVERFSDLDDLSSRAQTVLRAPGPRFLWMVVEPVSDDYVPGPLEPIGDRIERFRGAIEAS